MAIIGSSDALPYHSKKVKEIIKNPHFNFAVLGATNYEQHLFAQLLLSKKPDLKIIWQMNWLSFSWKEDYSRLEGNFPYELYEEKTLSNIFKVLFNPASAFKSLKILFSNKKSLIRINSISSWTAKDEKIIFEDVLDKRLNNFFNFLNKNKAVKVFDKNRFNLQFQNYIINIVKKYPRSAFVFVIPPIHPDFELKIQNRNPKLYEQSKYFKYKLGMLANQFKNVELINLSTSCNLDNNGLIYKDLTHFRNKYAIPFIKSILHQFKKNNIIKNVGCS